MVSASTPGSEVADGVRRLGTSQVNWYLVEDEGRFTVVDAGVPAYWPQLGQALGRLGRSSDDVVAIVLTHAHVDHIGFAERARTELGVPVLVHERDEELALTGKLPQRERGLLPYLRHRQARRLLAHLARSGAAKFPKVGEVTTFGDGDVLDVPGRPRVLHAPGHTDGICALHFERQGALVAGDVLCELNPLTGRRGPQIPPGAFNRSSRQALDSLARLEDLRADVVLFGHGDPWREGPAAAVARAREAGPS